MSLIQRPYQLRSDLVVHEPFAVEGYCRDIITVATGSDVTLKLGAVVYRAKGTDPTATWAVVTNATPFVTTNEFAVVLGTHYSYQLSDVTITAVEASKDLTAYVRGIVSLKDFTVRTAVEVNFPTISDVQFGVLKHLLSFQGVLVQEAGTVVRPTGF